MTDIPPEWAWLVPVGVLVAVITATVIGIKNKALGPLGRADIQGAAIVDSRAAAQLIRAIEALTAAQLRLAAALEESTEHLKDRDEAHDRRARLDAELAELRRTLKTEIEKLNGRPGAG